MRRPEGRPSSATTRPTRSPATPKRDVIAARGGNDTIRGLGGQRRDLRRRGRRHDRRRRGRRPALRRGDLLRIDQFGRVVKRGDTIRGRDAGRRHDRPRHADPRPWSATVRHAERRVRARRRPHSLSRRQRSTGHRLRRHDHRRRGRATTRSSTEVGAERRSSRTTLGRGGTDRLYGDAGDDDPRHRSASDTFVGGSGSDALGVDLGEPPVSAAAVASTRSQFPLPVESGFVAKGHGGQDKLRICPAPTRLSSRRCGSTSWRVDRPRPAALHARGQDHRLQRRSSCRPARRRSSRAATTPRSSPPTPTTACRSTAAGR